MVSPKTIELVKSTAPSLKEHGKQVTTRMYQILFEKHPELKGQFDMAAQADGSQPEKLATAVYTYAAHIDDPAALKSMYDKVANRHVQTRVTPEEYPIVGECLMQAMKDVLGGTATEEVITAWTEAYRELSDVFMNRQRELAK